MGNLRILGGYMKKLSIFTAAFLTILTNSALGAAKSMESIIRTTIDTSVHVESLLEKNILLDPIITEMHDKTGYYIVLQLSDLINKKQICGTLNCEISHNKTDIIALHSLRISGAGIKGPDGKKIYTYRGKGYGKLLFEIIKEIAYKLQRSIEWVAVPDNDDSDDDDDKPRIEIAKKDLTRLIQFYINLGGQMITKDLPSLLLLHSFSQKMYFKPKSIQKVILPTEEYKEKPIESKKTEHGTKRKIDDSSSSPGTHHVKAKVTK